MSAAENKQRIPSLIGGALAAAIAFAVYYLTKAPGITFIDSGELAAVCSIPGIAHPTGYPLYTIIGWLFIQLLQPVKPIIALNTLSAVFSCIALFVFSRSVVNLFNKNDIANRFPPVTGTAAAWSVFASSLLLAFSSVFWSVSLVTEVYALHGLFISLLIFLSLKAFAAGSKQEHVAPSSLFLWFALLSFVLGLSFCNHMSTVLFIPSLIYLFIAERIWQTIGVKRLLLVLVFFLCGISFYLYLPVRASYNPALNWGNPQTWETFLWHVSGKQYRVWMFSSPSVALQQLEYLLVLLMKSFGIVPLLLVPFGLWHLFHRNRRTLWFTLILLVTDILYTINYDIQDVDPYFLPVFFVFALWMGSAVLFFSDKALYKRKSFYYLVMCGLCSLFLFPLLLNFREVDQSKNRLVEQYSRTILQEVKQNALILSLPVGLFLLGMLLPAAGGRSQA